MVYLKRSYFKYVSFNHLKYKTIAKDNIKNFEL